VFRQLAEAAPWGRTTWPGTAAGPQLHATLSLNLVVDDTLLCHFIAYDEGYVTLSPGCQLEIENVQLFHDQPRFRMMDSCANPHKAFVNRLYPDRRSLVNVSIGAGLLGRALSSRWHPRAGVLWGLRMLARLSLGSVGLSSVLRAVLARRTSAGPTVRQDEAAGLEGTAGPGNES